MSDPARTRALEILQSVLRQRQTLEAAAGDAAGLSGPDHAFARRAAMTVIRRLGQIDDLIDRCVDRPLPAKARAAQDILRLGVAQILFMEVPDHAAVDTSVRLFKAHGAGGYAKLVNAVLRRITRDGKTWIATQDAPRLNTPDWLWQSWSDAFGLETCRKIAESHLKEVPLDLSCKDDPAGWAGRLGGQLMPGGTVRLNQAGAVSSLPGYDEGAWWVQDMAAHLVSNLLGDVRGKTVIDLCAAPGGKTAALAAAGANVTAVDRSASRLKRLAENLKRLKLEAEIVEADAAQWAPDQPADMVLLDAPCSATGTLRRHPDVARSKTMEDVRNLASLQRRLLAQASLMVKPGGILIYATCSLQPEEGENHLSQIHQDGLPLAPHPISSNDFKYLPEFFLRDGAYRSLPCQLTKDGGLDGFFACRFARP